MRYVWAFIFAEFGALRIKVFERNQGAVRLARNPVTTPNSKRIDEAPLPEGACVLRSVRHFARADCNAEEQYAAFMTKPFSSMSAFCHTSLGFLINTCSALLPGRGALLQFSFCVF